MSAAGDTFRITKAVAEQAKMDLDSMAILLEQFKAAQKIGDKRRLVGDAYRRLDLISNAQTGFEQAAKEYFYEACITVPNDKRIDEVAKLVKGMPEILKQAKKFIQEFRLPEDVRTPQAARPGGNGKISPAKVAVFMPLEPPKAQAKGKNTEASSAKKA